MAITKFMLDSEIETGKSNPRAIQGLTGAAGCTLMTKAAAGTYELSVKNVDGTPKVISVSITPPDSDFEAIMKEITKEIEETAMAMVKGEGNGEEVTVKISGKK